MTDLTDVTSAGSGAIITSAERTKLSGIATGAEVNVIDAVVDDTTPQLGGDLDVQARTITTSTSNGNVILEPDGTGLIQVNGDTNAGAIKLMCEQGSHGITIQSPAHTAVFAKDMVPVAVMVPPLNPVPVATLVTPCASSTQSRLPLPSVFSNWLALPSVLGKVRV